MTQPVPLTRLAARAVALHDPEPHHRKVELLEMLGIVAPGERGILPDAEPVQLDDMGLRIGSSTPSGFARPQEPPLRDRSALPEGLRDRPQMGRPPEPIEHGTSSGYRKHLRRKEKACESCLAAERRRVQDRRPRTTPRKPPADHGTAARYRAHRKAGEEACWPCKDAMRDYIEQNKASRRPPPPPEPEPVLVRVGEMVDASPPDAAREIAGVLEKWIADARGSRSPKVRAAGTATAAAVVRLRVAVEELEAVQRRSKATEAQEKESA